MKTSIEIDEKKVKIAKSYGQVDTLKELVDVALDAYIAQQKRRSLAKILGSGLISGSVDLMRGRKS